MALVGTQSQYPWWTTSDGSWYQNLQYRIVERVLSYNMSNIELNFLLDIPFSTAKYWKVCVHGRFVWMLVPLHRLNLELLNLERPNIERLNLEELNLEQLNLEQLNLEQLNLKCLKLEGLNLERLNLKRLNLGRQSIEKDLISKDGMSNAIKPRI